MDCALASPIFAVVITGKWLVQVLAIALVFGLIVFVHELGHFLTARLAGMAVYEFSLGFGRPLLFWFKRGETQYSIRLWPFISYVRIAGMEPGDDHPRGFDKKPRWARALVLVNGCVMNFALAVVLFIVLGVLFGKTIATSRVADVFPDTPAAKAGLVVGDRLVGLNGGTGASVDDIRAAILGSGGKPVALTVERGSTRATVSIAPQRNEVLELSGLRFRKTHVYQIGISFAGQRVPMGAWEAIAGGFTDTVGLLQEQIAGVHAMVTGLVKVKGNVMGPVGIVSTMYTVAQQSWMHFLSLAALLAVAVGFLNLLPIPPLDGSRLVILGYEGIIGRSVDRQKELVLHLVGMMILIGLVLLLTVFDVQRIFRHGG